MRRPLALGLAISVVALGAIVQPGVARACSCAFPSIEPLNGATGVPLNTRIWVPDGRAVSGQLVPRLQQMGGADVPVDQGALQLPIGLQVIILTPRAPLAPRTTYQILAGPPNPLVSSFTTGDAVDVTSPEVPEGRQVKACADLTPNSSCGPSLQSLVFSIPTTDTRLLVLTAGQVPPAPVLDRVRSSSPPEPTPVAFLGYATSFDVSLGNGGCGSWPFPATTGAVFYGAIDLAGNFSGWRAGGTATLPPLPATPSGDLFAACTPLPPDGLPPAPLDAAPSPPIDAGPPADAKVITPLDATSNNQDAGFDTKPAPIDAGTVETVAERGGSCNIGGPSSASGFPVLLLILGFAGRFVAGRRRSGCQDAGTPGTAPLGD